MEDTRNQKIQKRGGLAKSMKNVKGQEGITLIALIITIIILVILAAVSIRAAYNSGIIDYAVNGTQNYIQGASEEKSRIENANSVLTSVIERLENLGKNGGGSTPVVINHEIYDQFEIGSEIYYKPSGQFTWDTDYYCSSDYNWLTSSEYEDVILACGDRIDELNLQDIEYCGVTIERWKVFSKNDLTGEICLVPAQELTPNAAPLQGAQGYNNGVKLLNDACNELYGDTTRNITARSINIEDIENLMSDEELAQAREADEYEYPDYPGYGNRYTSPNPQNPEEGDTIYRNSTGAFVENAKYPVIYGQEANREIGGTIYTTGLERSEQDEYIAKDAGTSSEYDIGYITTATSIRPVMNYEGFSFERQKLIETTTVLFGRLLDSITLHCP